MKKLLEKINNVTLFQKMALIYIACIILPLTAIGTFYYGATISQIKEENRSNINFLLVKGKENIQKNIFQSLSWTGSMYLDEELYSLLDETYETFSGVQNVINYIEKCVLYPPYESGVLNVEIYTDNPTLYSGVNLRKIDKWCKDTEWYKKHLENESDVTVVSFEQIKDEASIFDRSVSIIRDMNHYSEYDREKLIKLDISVDNLKNILKDLNINNTVFLLDENYNVITSTEFGAVFKKTNNTMIVDCDYGDLHGWKIATDISSFPLDGSFIRDAVIFVIIMLCIITFTFFVTYFVSRSIINRFALLTECMNKMENHIFEPIDEEAVGSDEIADLIYGMNELTLKTKHLIEEVYNAELREKAIEIEKRNAELKALQSQVNPHFLFNTLETIRLKSLMKQEKETANIIKNLSKMFRRMISWGDDIITFSEELEYVNEYLEIQKYRFGEELEIIKNIDENAGDYRLPKMVFQVFVENACVHGAENTLGKKTIEISAKAEEKMLVLTVEDNGMGMDKDTVDSILDGKNSEKKNVGTKNAINRLRHYYNDDFKIEIDTVLNCRTKITLKIPQSEEL